MREMLSVGNTLSGSGASLSLDARVAVGAGVFAISSAETSSAVTQAPVVTTSDQRLPAYNAFEFTYRSDFGKIILLQQNVETGQAVTQIPTEYHLQQYAATQRQSRVQQLHKLLGNSGGEAQTGDTVAVATTAKPATSPSGLSAPAPSQPAAPVVAPSTVATAAAAHVDIKV
jgi:hypothetical protein